MKERKKNFRLSQIIWPCYDFVFGNELHKKDSNIISIKGDKKNLFKQQSLIFCVITIVNVLKQLLFSIFNYYYKYLQ